MLPAGFELITDEPDAVKINPHRKLLIFFLYFPTAGAFPGQCLVVQGECQHDIRPEFPGMERAVESPEFYRMIAMEETVQVEHIMCSYT